MYYGSAFYKVSENTFVQAGDIEYGNINNLDYSKIGSGKSGLGLLNSELSNDFKFTEGSVVLLEQQNLIQRIVNSLLH